MAIFPLILNAPLRVLKGSYAALSFTEDQLEAVNSFLEEILGADYEDLKGNRDRRDGYSYHCTVLTPREFRAVAQAQGGRVPLPRESYELKLQGIGRAGNRLSSAWFAVAESEVLQDLRATWDLPVQDLHITLAFGAGGDVHGVAKDRSTIL